MTVLTIHNILETMAWGHFKNGTDVHISNKFLLSNPHWKVGDQIDVEITQWKDFDHPTVDKLLAELPAASDDPYDSEKLRIDKPLEAAPPAPQADIEPTLIDLREQRGHALKLAAFLERNMGNLIDKYGKPDSWNNSKPQGVTFSVDGVDISR